MNNNEILQEMSNIETEIAKAKRNLNQLEGRLEEIRKNTLKEFGTSHKEELKKLLDETSESQKKVDELIQKEYQELKSKFTW